MDLVNVYSDSSSSATPVNSPPQSPKPQNPSSSVVVPLSGTAPSPSGTESKAIKLVTGTAETINFDNVNFSRLERSLAATGTTIDPLSGKLLTPRIPGTIEPLATSLPSKKRESDEVNVKAQKDGSQGKPKRPRTVNSKLTVPSSMLYIDETYDYQCRSWTMPPASARTFEDLETYTPFIPKKCVHDLKAHDRGVSVVRFWAPYGHLLLTTGLDGVARVWDAGKARCIRSYAGHSKGIRDAVFSPDNKSFLTAGYDRAIRLWDMETGRVTGSFSTSAIPYCVCFSPLQNGTEFLTGCGDKKVLQIDIRDASGVVQQYDQHMGAVNSLSFVDDDRRFVSSSDDKVLRLWEYGVPVIIRHVSDPTANSMPVTLLHPNRKSLACQSMDNTIRIFTAYDKFIPNTKKIFRGHLVAGYACGLQTSPDGRYLVSGDSLGRMFFWDWKTTRIFRAVEAHSGVCVGVDWHPTRSSFVASCGWDGRLKLWD